MTEEWKTGTMFRCRNCKEIVVCAAGENHVLTEIEGHNGEGDWLYSCSTCLDLGDGAFGSIRHWCTDMLGMISGKPLVKPETIEGAFMAVILEAERKEPQPMCASCGEKPETQTPYCDDCWAEAAKHPWMHQK